MQRNHVWMTQPRGCFGFAKKPSPWLIIHECINARNLEGHRPTQFEVTGQVHDAQSTAANFPLDDEPAEKQWRGCFWRRLQVRFRHIECSARAIEQFEPPFFFSPLRR